MALKVEVGGVGICRTVSPTIVFIICVQQERYEPWTVYRRFQNFGFLREQLLNHHGGIQLLPNFDESNFSFEYLEGARQFLDRWLQNLASNTFILRMQCMYHFLCTDANMPPPYLEFLNRNYQEAANEDLEMDEMFDDEAGNWDGNHANEDDEDHDHENSEAMETVFTMDTDRGSVSKAKGDGRSPRLASSFRTQQIQAKHKEDEEDEAKEIQSLSVVEAEFIYDKKDDNKSQEEDSTQPKRTISLEAFKIIKVIGKGKHTLFYSVA
jgi:hypothetical protein